ncbi:MAG TPA: ZIP family metal transporter [Burkholderiaceae bacterium]|nr:ZIP family metal transporter [Burkholderiaceae bacterium]
MALQSRSASLISLRTICLAALIIGVVVLATVALFTLPGLAGQPVRHALWGASIAALATGLGALPVLFASPPSQRARDTLFGFGAGVMLAACTFSLILPGLNAAAQLGHGNWASAGMMAAAVSLGAAALFLIERVLPHEHFVKGVEGGQPGNIRQTWLFVFAIALHNFPEGFAIGASFAGDYAAGATALSMGIAIQDVPEGLIVALALLTAGYARGVSVLLAALSGLVEPLGAFIGVSAIAYAAGLLPWGLGFAAGAMLFVVSHEIIPESHRQGHERHATAGLVGGFVMMLALDAGMA